MANKTKPAVEVEQPTQEEPVKWEDLTTDAKVNRLLAVIDTLHRNHETLKRAFLNHNHADGVVVGKMSL